MKKISFEDVDVYGQNMRVQILEMPPCTRTIKIIFEDNKYTKKIDFVKIKLPYTQFAKITKILKNYSSHAVVNQLVFRESCYLFQSKESVLSLLDENIITLRAAYLPNVDSGGLICWGNNPIGTIEEDILTFWSSVFNEDLGFLRKDKLEKCEAAPYSKDVVFHPKYEKTNDDNIFFNFFYLTSKEKIDFLTKHNCYGSKTEYKSGFSIEYKKACEIFKELSDQNGN